MRGPQHIIKKSPYTWYDHQNSPEEIARDSHPEGWRTTLIMLSRELVTTIDGNHHSTYPYKIFLLYHSQHGLIRQLTCTVFLTLLWHLHS